MLDHLVELQRQVCSARAKAGMPWYELKVAREVEAGRLIADKDNLRNFEEELNESWDDLPIRMTTDETSEYLQMSDDWPVLIEDIDPDESVLVFPEMTLYAQIEEISYAAKQAGISCKTAEVPKAPVRPVRKLEFI